MADDDTLIYFGGIVKALGGGRVGGYVVRFGTPASADVQGDYFTAATDYGLDVSTKARVVYHHGFDPTIGRRKIGVADLAMVADGIVAEALLTEPTIYVKAEAGELGWSSGSTKHLADKRPMGGAYEVIAWPIAEVSLTKTPVDPRNRAVPIKSLVGDEAGAAGSLADRSARLVADVGDVLGLLRKCADQRAAEGRTLSAAKRAEVKALADGLSALLAQTAPRPDPAELEALRRRLLADRL